MSREINIYVVNYVASYVFFYVYKEKAPIKILKMLKT